MLAWFMFPCKHNHRDARVIYGCINRAIYMFKVVLSNKMTTD